MGINLNEVRARLEQQKQEKAGVVLANAPQELQVEVKEIIIPVSDSQKVTYLKLCREKDQAVDMTYTKWDGRKGGQMDKEIKRLLTLQSIKRPTEAQIQTLKDICERNDWELPDFAQLTGGRDGSMSKLLSELIALEKEVQRTQPLTESQYLTIIEMYYCTDIDFSDLHPSLSITSTVHDGKVFWSRPDESLLAKLEEFITYQEASNFIYKYAPIFHKWKVTRLTDAQIVRIQTLQKKNGMQPMEAYQLMSMDKKQADTYISNLEYVWRDRDLVKFPQESMFDRKAFDENHTKDIEQAEEKSYNDRANIIHSIYAMMGMRASEEDFIESECGEDIVREASALATEICGVQAVYDLLIEVYNEEEVCDILNIDKPGTEENVPF